MHVIEIPRQHAKPRLPTNRGRDTHRLSTQSSSLQYLLKQVIVSVQGLVLFAQSSDRSARVQYRGVVAVAESFADFRQAELGEVPRECHRDLARACDVARALLRVHVGELDLEVL